MDDVQMTLLKTTMARYKTEWFPSIGCSDVYYYTLFN
jgi:hypothetical protein